MTNHLCHNILTNQQWFLQQQETPTGVAWLAADFVGKGGCEGHYVSTPLSLRLSHLLIHPMLPFAIKPGSYTCYTTTGVSCLHRAYAWMKFLAHNKKKRTPSSDQLCTDTVFSSFFEKKKLVRLQALAKSQNWPACWTSFFENKIGYFWKFLLDTFLPFIQILRNGHSF